MRPGNRSPVLPTCSAPPPANPCSSTWPPHSTSASVTAVSSSPALTHMSRVIFDHIKAQYIYFLAQSPQISVFIWRMHLTIIFVNLNVYLKQGPLKTCVCSSGASIEVNALEWSNIACFMNCSLLKLRMYLCQWPTLLRRLPNAPLAVGLSSALMADW